jgi:hypothetical protein
MTFLHGFLPAERWASRMVEPHCKFNVGPVRPRRERGYGGRWQGFVLKTLKPASVHNLSAFFPQLEGEVKTNLCGWPIHAISMNVCLA